MSPHHQPDADEPTVTRERSTYLTDSEAATFCTVFGDGLDSGMGYARIIDMLERQGYDGKVTDALRTAILEEGNRLADALQKNGLLDATGRKLLRVAEEQGTMPGTFKELGAYYSQRQKRRKTFISSLVEPCILVALGLILARNLMGGDLVAIAQSTDVFENLKPIFIQSGIEIAIFGSVAAFLGFAYLNLPVDMRLRTAAHRLWLTFPLPMLNTSGREYSLATFFNYLHKSITSGLTVHQALSLAAEASNDPNIERRIGDARRGLEEGKMLAASLRQSKAVPSDAIDYIDVGEESGRLDERLAELGERYEEKADKSFEQTLKGSVYILRMVVVVLVIAGLMVSVGDMFSEMMGSGV